MATYKGREVQIVNELPTAGLHLVVIEHDGMTETVDRGSIEFSPEEMRKQAEEDKKTADQRVKDHEERAKAREERAKLEVEHRKEVEAARQKGHPENVWLKTGQYNKGDQVTVDGILYSSRMNGNQGNQPSAKSDAWRVVEQDITNRVPQTDRTTQVPLGKPVVIGGNQAAAVAPAVQPVNKRS